MQPGDILTYDFDVKPHSEDREPRWLAHASRYPLSVFHSFCNHAHHFHLCLFAFWKAMRHKPQRWLACLPEYSSQHWTAPPCQRQRGAAF